MHLLIWSENAASKLPPTVPFGSMGGIIRPFWTNVIPAAFIFLTTASNSF